jgi:hypothetical protein
MNGSIVPTARKDLAMAFKNENMDTFTGRKR